jgi:hypothetical protein
MLKTELQQALDQEIEAFFFTRNLFEIGPASHKACDDGPL